MAELLYRRNGLPYDHSPITNDSGKLGYYYQARCTRCGGAGGGEQWRHTGWTCYQCGGSGLGSRSFERLYTMPELDRLNAIAAKREATAEAKRQARAAEESAAADRRKAAFLGEHGEYLAQVENTCDAHSFAHRILATIHQHCFISPAQRELLDKLMAESLYKSNAKYIGTIGERREFEGTILKRTGWRNEAYRTYTNLFIVSTAEGIVKYMGSGSLGGDQGEVVRFTATIKDHAEYQGTKQTVVDRPRVKVGDNHA